MAIKRADLEKLLEGVEKKDEIINYVMAENGKSINDANAKYEELRTQKDELQKQFDDYKKQTGDYETIKKSNDELTAKVKGFEAEKANKDYYDKLEKLGFDKDFIDEDIFKKIPKPADNKMESFEASAKKYLEEHPKYRAEPVVNHGGFEFKGSTNPDGTMSDEELLAQLKKANKPADNS